MKRLATLGVAAVLGMALFTPLMTTSTYAIGPSACGTAVANDGMVEIEDSTVTCAVVMTFANAINVDDLVITFVEDITADDYTVAADGTTVTLTIKESGVEKLRASYGSYLSVAENDGLGAEEISCYVSAAPIREQYAVLDGDAQTWNPASEQGLTIRFDGPFADYAGLEIINMTKFNALRDAGVDLAELSLEEQAEIFYEEWYDNLHEGVDYTVASGSTIVTLSRDFLATLPAGEYDVVVYYADGEGVATFTISGEEEATETSASAGVPDTGVMTKEEASAHAAISGLFAAVVTTLAGAAAMVRRKIARK